MAYPQSSTDWLFVTSRVLLCSSLNQSAELDLAPAEDALEKPALRSPCGTYPRRVVLSR
jgi:hypothetical protein